MPRSADVPSPPPSPAAPRRAVHGRAHTHLHAHLRDRARLRAFLRFLGKRTLEDDLFQAAGALSYTTVFALVPLSMVVFGVLSAFPVFGEWSDRLSDYVFSNFVPNAASAVQTHLRQFSANAGQLTAAGVIALVASLLITVSGVEAAFNRIWRVKSARPNFARFLMYWTVLTLGALLAAASLAMSARFFALSIFETQVGSALEQFALRLAPMGIAFLAIAVIYRVVPHRTIHWRYAFAGAAIAALLLEAVRSGLGLYLGSFGNYAVIYGAVSFVPIFLLWIYLSWTTVLLGASFASSLSAFRYQPAHLRLPEGYEFYALLRLIARFREARLGGRGLHINDIQSLEPILTDALAQQLLAQLCEINLVRRAEDGEWLLARDLDAISLADLYEACQLRVPIAEAHLPARDDAIGRAALEVLDELRIPLRAQLKRRVASLQESVDP